MEDAASAATTFNPIAGSLVIQVGSKPQQTTPALVGSASLLDTAIAPEIGGFFSASTSLTVGIANNSLLTFSASASSVTNQAPPPGETYATSTVTLTQTFVTTTPQWIEMRGRAEIPPNTTGVFTSLQVRRTGQPVPLLNILDTAGHVALAGGWFPAGTYAVQGSIATTAPSPGAHFGNIDGAVLIASLADFNGGLVVDGFDLATLLTGYGSTNGLFAAGNVDGDGDTDGNDFLIWQRQVGAHPFLAIAAPEPAGPLLALTATCAAMRYSRTRRWAAR
jgi:hypothetical protein